MVSTIRLHLQSHDGWQLCRFLRVYQPSASVCSINTSSILLFFHHNNINKQPTTKKET